MHDEVVRLLQRGLAIAKTDARLALLLGKPLETVGNWRSGTVVPGLHEVQRLRDLVLELEARALEDVRKNPSRKLRK